MKITKDDIATLAAACDGVSWFVDPGHLREAQDAIVQAPPEWLMDLLGRIPSGGVRNLSPKEISMVALASREFPPRSYPSPTREAELASARAAEAERRKLARKEQARARRGWDTLRNALPVKVFVGHNWSLGHYELQTTGKDHIVVQEVVSVGRFRRESKKALCETPSKEYDLRALERTAETSVGRKDDDRLPTCAACLKHAKKLAGEV